MQATDDARREPMSGAAAAAAPVQPHIVAPSKPGVASEPRVERFRARAGVSAARAAGATVLLDVRSALYHTLNEPASRLWDVIEAGDATLATLVDVLDVEGHDVPRETITRDVMHLLETFLEAGLITTELVTAEQPGSDGVRRGEGGDT